MKKNFERQKIPKKNTKKKTNDKNTNEKKIVPKTTFVDHKKTRMDNMLVDNIDRKLTNIINERLLKLVSIGLAHELSIENMIQYFKGVETSKLYELKRYFSDSNLIKIKEILDFLHNDGTLVKHANGWYGLK